MNYLISAWSRVRSALFGGSRQPLPPVIIHDPAAEGPQNLDDPFLDAKAQERIGQMIGRRAKPPG